MRMRLFTIGLLFLAGYLFALEVDIVELESVTNTINFVNFTGVQSEDTDTIASIRGIGESLAVDIGSTASIVYNQKYRITHLLPSEDGRRGVDLFELLPAARVDHIDNLRRIISAYLEGRYAYSADDARLLGTLITVYNAVHRGNVELFRRRYTTELDPLLGEQKAGLSLLYSEWPGASQVIIPIAADATAGELSSVPADELLDEAVEETLRDASDLGLEDRMEAADLIDRTVDEERSQIEEAQRDLIQQRRILAERLQLDGQPTELLQQQQQELAQQEDGIDDRLAAVAVAETRSDEIRESVAKDLETTATLAEVVPLRITRGRLAGEGLFATILIINANGGSVLMRADREIIGRNYLVTRKGLIAISEEAGAPALVLFNDDDLSFVLKSSAEISRHSPVIAGAGDDIYAIIKEGNKWYAGRFDTNLTLLFRSTLAVAEESDLVIEDGRLFVQREDGRFSGLDVDELRVSP